MFSLIFLWVFLFVFVGPSNGKCFCCAMFIHNYLLISCEENYKRGIWKILRLSDSYRLQRSPSEGPGTDPQLCVWLTHSKMWCFLKNMLICCGLATVPSLKPVCPGWRGSQGASVRWSVCVLVCVCVRAYACITGFSWLSQNGIPVADTPKPEVWRLFQYAALSLSFDHSSAASTFQISAIYVATFFFYCVWLWLSKVF